MTPFQTFWDHIVLNFENLDQQESITGSSAAEIQQTYQTALRDEFGLMKNLPVLNSYGDFKLYSGSTFLLVSLDEILEELHSVKLETKKLSGNFFFMIKIK